MPIAAIYARVSSDKQREESTIASQTAALIEFARSRGYQVPAEWVFEDEGYSGASLVRPGLEQLRDLAAEGQIEAVLVHAPDRLSRKYAYQVLLIEELGRHGVETIFVKAPRGATAEDQLLVQFQGMIAEYERAQILERSRRGKGTAAKLGVRAPRRHCCAFRRRGDWARGLDFEVGGDRRRGRRAGSRRLGDQSTRQPRWYRRSGVDPV